MKNKILITNPTGKTGYETAVNLLKNGYPVRIFNRSRNSRALELENLGAELVIGNLDNEQDIIAALEGVSKVYYCYPILPNLIPAIKWFIKAAQENHIEALVFMGQWLAEFDDQKSLLTNNIREAYTLLEQSGLNVIYFIPGFFADNFNFVLENSIQFGWMPNPLGGGDNPAPSTEDMALVLYHLLINPDPYIGKRLRPTGPKTLGPSEMADAISKVIGRKVRPFNLPRWMVIKALFAGAMEFSLSDFMISQTLYYFEENKKGKFAIGGPTQVVKEITGKEPDDFETIVKRWNEKSTYRERNLKNGLNAFKKFIAIPFQSVLSEKELALLNQ